MTQFTVDCLTVLGVFIVSFVLHIGLMLFADRGRGYNFLTRPTKEDNEE